MVGAQQLLEQASLNMPISALCKQAVSFCAHEIATDIHGMQPFGFHLTNVLLHIVAS